MGALLVLGSAARRRSIAVADLAPPLRASTLANFATLRRAYWPAVWLSIAAIPLMAVVPIGLARLAPLERGVTDMATVVYLIGLAFGAVHVGLQSVAQTSVAWRFADATDAERPGLLSIATTLYDANDLFEKAWGLCRGAAALLFGIALVSGGGPSSWVGLLSLVGALELPLRAVQIGRNRPSGGAQDLPFAVWLVGMGVGLLTA
jgi:hypothetical protein